MRAENLNFKIINEKKYNLKHIRFYCNRGNVIDVEKSKIFFKIKSYLFKS